MRGALSITVDHSHQWDELGLFRAKHKHTFAEADDHYHNEKNGEGIGTSPHDEHLPHHKCSSCGHGL